MQHGVAVHGRVRHRRQIQRRGDVLRQGQPQTFQRGQLNGVQRRKVGDDARERLFHLQHILVAVSVVVAAMMPTMMALTVVAVTVVMDAFVVSVAVGVVSVQVSGALLGSHNVAVRVCCGADGLISYHSTEGFSRARWRPLPAPGRGSNR